MVSDLGNVEELLKEKYGSIGVEYLAPQLDVIRSARNLPSTLDDYRLMTQRMHESFQMILQWLAPVVVPVSEELTELEAQLQELQYQIKFQIKQEDLKYWREIEESNNPTIKSLFSEIKQLRGYILQQREKLLHAAHRAELPRLFGLVLWPYTEHLNAREVLKEIKSSYFGPNYFYNKNNIFCDSIILTAVAEDCLQQKKDSSSADRQIESLIETRLSFRRIEEQFEWSKYKRDPNDGYFTEMQVNEIIRTLLPGLPVSEKSSLYNVYDDTTDRYPIGNFLDWLKSALRRKTATREDEEIRGESSSAERHLIGLSFMDKHRRKEILGNISDLGDIFERILGPFHELKQENAFMQSAQFEIENVMELGSQAWIYDYSGIETAISRSTLLLISDKQPKFDVLEACQRLANSVLSGRVDRNDIREGNYTVTNQLPPRMWNFIGNSLLTILEEALVKEEAHSVSLIKNLFKDEDRSRLVTSKKFIPVFLIQTDFKRGIDYLTKDKGLLPQTMSVWSRDDFIFQYRFAQLGGYPWYFDNNELLETLLVEALNLPTHKISQLHGNVKLRQTVYTIDDETFIVYYGVEGEKIQALAFKEVDILSEEGIDPVEVIFRPHKFLRMGPEKNNLNLILDQARATDPKDLRTIIAGL
ncbi:MAG: hypothetical protein JSU57_02995 [Candidatus Heimdallarchaeota archaeon]|nr:MAG: hypothetical protein JSU57_02995 [Candidatus Heimdallarchaeota archaeon]